MKIKNKVYFQTINTWCDPEIVFEFLFERKNYAFWLDSSKVEKGFARFSYMGDVSGPFAKKISYSVLDKTLVIEKEKKKKKIKQSIFDYLEKELKNKSQANHNNRLPFDFTGGFVGYFGYELQAECGSKFCHKSQFPDAHFFFVDRFLAFDHLKHKIYLVCLSEKKKEAEKWFEETKKKFFVIPRVEESQATSLEDNRLLYSQSQWCEIPRLPRQTRLSQNAKQLTFIFARNHDQYLQDIKKCQEYLQNGESYQICLTNQITADLKTDWLELYKILRKINPAPFSSYMRFGDFAVLSSSPEMFLKIDKNRKITSKPIKGTVKRGETTKQDKYLVENLGKTEKDYAENIMIVDLVRNDLGKVCEIGSVNVPKLLAVETYATVHQLVSTVTGKMRKDLSAIYAIKAAFPGGSMTGAPKIRAMEIISRLEKNPRGIYSGALGFLSLNGTVHLSMVIRTIIAQKEKFSFGSGGAILLQSDPESEYNEMMLKAEALMKAIEIASSYKVILSRG